MVFVVAAVIIGLIGKLGEERTVNAIVAGAGEFLGAALIIVLARAVTVVMKNADDHRHDHPLDRGRGQRHVGARSSARWRSSSTCRSRSWCPSSSGHAALIMPILAPLADFADVNRSIAVTAYQSASGLVNYITPTSAVVMGGLVLAKVRYDHYLRFALPVRRRSRRSSSASSWRSARRSADGGRATSRTKGTMTLNAASEVGKLRRVIVHRPGPRAHPAHAVERRGPAVRRRDLGQAGQAGARRVRRGDARARRRGVLRRGAADRGARDRRGARLGRRPGPRRAPRRPRPRPLAPGVGGERRPGRGRRLPDRRDHQGGPRATAPASSTTPASAATCCVPPLPNFLFQRDPVVAGSSTASRSTR